LDCGEIDLRALSPKPEQPFEPLGEPGVGLE
jgi:hypothetical protein